MVLIGEDGLLDLLGGRGDVDGLDEGERHDEAGRTEKDAEAKHHDCSELSSGSPQIVQYFLYRNGTCCVEK